MYIANLMVIISSICTVIALVLSWRTISAISRLIKAGDKENGRLQKAVKVQYLLYLRHILHFVISQHGESARHHIFPPPVWEHH